MVISKNDSSKMQIRDVRFLPQDLTSEPAFPSDLKVFDNVNVTLSNLFGQTEDGGRLVHATLWNALKVSGYGAGYTHYDSLTDAAPAAYSSTHQLSGSPYLQKADIYAPSADLLIRFQSVHDGTWGDDIYVPKGFMSIEFVASSIQVKLATATLSDYHISVFW